MFCSFGGGSQHSLQRPRLLVLLHFHLIEKTVKHNFLTVLYAVRTEAPLATANSIKSFRASGEFTSGFQTCCALPHLIQVSRLGVDSHVTGKNND